MTDQTKPGVGPGTPLPWAIGKFGDVTAGTDSDGDPFLVLRSRNSICSSYSMGGANQQARDLRYIVRACNSFPSLYEALEKAEQHIATMLTAIAGGNAEAGRNFADKDPVVANIRAALLSAREGV